ncbi:MULTISPECIES: DUF3857 domain-containing protein [Mesonia]|uniref:Uncharacterized protein n=1 Tax=Mesonia oceanica TaxID=2687242 RepID=A0AC61Y7V9_9FLAO|nr:MULTISPECIES: transglutaminase domain-containing protein [Mesonia]MBJ97066.1 DUF3857 domain-containing protein [Flavobacteriaceae bacterium]MAN29456.1 DUF3857 domain-containing protein [Mesonia sp.]MAQ39435.1 DUF3857 domain-containing protein [Mesonia sp.]MAQ42110.1 DUF3857 domain-containing protein [Mesonia sp.]VVV00582.1 hypothetical protein FVB9532_01854 [Mesonia oceanica]|tara:strand:- start:37606 stop:39510 length:1905 start_codon:yes stop_codon:yes gene_type:complete
MKKIVLMSIFWISTLAIYAQKNIIPIDASEFRNSNAVIRNYTTEIELNGNSSMTVKQYSLITVLNSKGDDFAFCYAYYDDDISLKNVEVLIYNASGDLIKKIKEKDFTDRSAVSGSTLYSDSRAKYLDYKPTGYPYSIAFTKEYKTDNTAFVPSHSFIQDYDTYVQSSSYQLLFDKNETKLTIKEKNFENFEVKKEENPSGVIYSITDVKPIPREDFHLPLSGVVPQVLVMPQNFNLSGYKAQNVTNWQELGKWFSNKVLADRTELPSSTIEKVKQLTNGVEDPLEKAKIIYDYVQNNTRYISVQVGIGGYQPIVASEVDEMKYGDCKGLSNYTKALLEAVGVEAYYTHVESGKTKIDFEDDFASLAQGNHAILAIPYQDSYQWIDCTSQTIPFGFLGDFTDDRKVLVIKPEGGEIIKTPAYLNEDNYQFTQALVKFANTGEVNVEGKIITKGIQYDDRQYLEHYSPDDLKKRDFEYWSSIDNLQVKEHKMKNDKAEVQFTETFQLKGNNFGTPSGERLFIPINPISAITYIPKRYRNRKTAFQIARGYWDEDEIEILIPKGYSVEAKPDNVEINTEFGAYKMSIEIKDHKIIYKKDILIKEGTYPKEKYSEYRDFRENIAKSEEKKISLIAKE